MLAFFRKGTVLPAPPPKTPSLGLIILVNYHPVSNLSFLEKVVEKETGVQLMNALEEMDYLELFHSVPAKI